MVRHESRITLRKLSELTGYSISTVSRALANNPAIATETREKVKKIAAVEGYRPNAHARALRSAETFTVGIVVPSLVNYFFASMVTAAQKWLRERGYTTLILNSDEQADQLIDSLDRLVEQSVDGVICVPLEDASEAIVNFAARGIHTVLVDRDLPSADLPTVLSNPRPGITAAVDLLRANELLPVGYLSGPMKSSTARDRLRTFRSVCHENGLAEQPTFLGGFDQETGRSGTLQLLQQGVSTIFAGDSMMTVGALQACHDNQLVIGRDVAIVGFDSHPAFSLQPRPITVVDQDVESMAIEAAQLLHRLIIGETVKESHVVIETHLIQKQSTEKLTTKQEVNDGSK